MTQRPGAVIAVISVLLAAGLVGLFAFQNHTRTTQLSLDLGVQAWQLQTPVMVPALMAVCFGVGFAVAALWFGGRLIGANRRVRKLEQELALAGGSAEDGWR